ALETIQQLPGQKSLDFLLTKGKRGSALDATIALNELRKIGCKDEILWLLDGWSPAQLPDEIVRLWAMVAQDREKHQLAISLWKHILRTQPDYVKRHGLGAINNLIAMKAFGDALIELNRSEPLFSSQTKYWLLRTQALRGIDRLEEAEQAVDKGLGIDP